jgi:UDP-N-acetylmuramoyl-L-alanyl-D-glutamate--2,6-diaminopimelate ligase
MNWNHLIAEITAVGCAGSSAASITGIEYDSRRVKPGTVFVAMKGGSTDGNRYIEKAIAAGALAIITDSAQTFDHLTVYQPGLPVLHVEHGRRALAEASAAFFRHPERALAATGITGTNGKTTTAFLTEALLNAAAHSTILIGTIEYHVAGEVRPSVHTTPESRDVFELMAEGVSRGATEFVTEVSSHALDQGRMIGIPFDVAVFTNLTRDHLDYHLTMENYFAAKRLLFDGTVYPAPRVAVVNAHDPRSEEIAAAARKAGAEIRTYGIGKGDWRAASFRLTPSGATIELETPAGAACVTSRLAGEVNILNLLAAFTAAHARGVAFSHLAAAVPALRPVPGRFQPVDAGQPFTVIVDYAHTDDALRNLTALARQMTAAAGTRVITLFGCGWARPPARAAISSSPPATIRAQRIPRPFLPRSNPDCGRPASNTSWNPIVRRQFVSPSRPRNPATSCYWPEKGTKTNKSSPAARFLLTTPKLHFPSCANWAMVEGNEPDFG